MNTVRREGAGAVTGFAPLVGPGARVLILGSLPGVASLQAGAYYAQPRNAFWPIMGALFGAGPGLDYRQGVALLRAHGVAVWDVLHAAVRPGSLDAAIDPATQVANDFAGFFAANPDLGHVFFNGAKAEALFFRLVTARPCRVDCAYTRLPSTSPAHAALSLADKRAAWSVLARAAAFRPASGPGDTAPDRR